MNKECVDGYRLFWQFHIFHWNDGTTTLSFEYKNENNISSQWYILTW